MSKEKLSKDVAEPSSIEKLQSELKEGGPVLDQLNHQLTENLYDALSAYNVMTDLDSLYDIVEKSVKTTIGVWVGGSTEPIVSHDALALAEEQKADNPDLDTRKSWNDPNDNLALAGAVRVEANDPVEPSTVEGTVPPKKTDKKKADKE